MDSYFSSDIEDLDVGLRTLPRFGIAMEGNETTLVRAAQLALRHHKHGKKFRYVEIGIAGGMTLRAMGVSLLSLGVDAEDLEIYGVDLEDGWSLDRETLKRNMSKFTCRVTIDYSGSEEWLKTFTTPPIHFLMVDGCHEKECCERDFLLAERHIAKGGVVAFHDSDELSQGNQPQPHRGQPVGVRVGLKELGLLSDERDGWKKLADIEAFPGNHGIAIFQKGYSHGNGQGH